MGVTMRGEESGKVHRDERRGDKGDGVLRGVYRIVSRQRPYAHANSSRLRPHQHPYPAQ